MTTQGRPSGGAGALGSVPMPKAASAENTKPPKETNQVVNSTQAVEFSGALKQAQSADPVQAAVETQKTEPVTQKADEQVDASGLTKEQQQMVAQLSSLHDKVTQHQQAKASVGGQYASSPQYLWTVGPDGKRYAVSGNVALDVSPESEPESTVSKMEIVKRAALAPQQPDPQDRRIALVAEGLRAEALLQIREQRQIEMEKPRSPKDVGAMYEKASRVMDAHGVDQGSRVMFDQSESK